MTDNTITDEKSGIRNPVPRVHMKIAQAKSLYEEFGDDFRQDMDSLVRLFRENGVEGALDNGNYLHALSLTDLMFRHTDQSLRMLTGNAGDGFLTCLSHSFVSMLQRIKDRGGKAKIVFLNSDPFGEEFRKIQDKFQGTLEVIRATAPGALEHYIVCDDDMVRDEEKHGELSECSSASEIKAKVYFRNKTMAKVFSLKFNQLWNKLSK